MMDPVEEFVDLFYYHAVTGVPFDKDRFARFLNQVPVESKSELTRMTTGLLGHGNQVNAWELIAERLFDRIADTKGGSVLIPTVIANLIRADSRFSTEVARKFTAKCFQKKKYQQVVTDILVRFALEHERTDAPMYEYTLECLGDLDMDPQQQELVFVMLAKNLHSQAGRLALTQSHLVPTEADHVFSVFSVCDTTCTSVMIQGLANIKHGPDVIASLVGTLVQQPGSTALKSLGKLYICAGNDPFGEEVRARARAAVVLVVERLTKNDIPDLTDVSMDLLIGLSLSLGLGGTQSAVLAKSAVNGILQILKSMEISEQDFPVFSQAVVRILQQVASDRSLLQQFTSGIGGIAGHLYTALRNEETRQQAQTAFRVLEHVIESQSRIGRPLPAVKAIVDNYRKQK